MRIISKYTTKEYLRFFFAFALLFIFIFLLAEFFETVDKLKKDAELFKVLEYYLLQVPYLFYLLSPLSCLLATLFTLSYLGSTYQIQALQVSGISAKRLALPLLVLGILLSLSLIFLQETLIFASNKKSQELKREFFARGTFQEKQRNVFVQAPPDWLLYIRFFHPSWGKMEKVLIYRRSSSSLWIAEEGLWSKGGWLLKKGIKYRVGETKGERFATFLLPLKKDPYYFTRGWLSPERMSLSLLKRYISEYKLSGFNTQDLETEYHFKYVYPLSNLILIFFGVSLGVILKRGGRGASFALGSLLGLAYYEAMALSKAVGKAGTLPPFFAAWVPGLVFLGGGIYLFLRMEKV